MFRVTKEYGEMPSGGRLVSGNVLLTVTEVEGNRIKGWYYTEFWRDEIAISLLRNTECAYADWTEDQHELDEHGNWVNTLECECADCVMEDGDYHNHWAGYEAESLTVEGRIHYGVEAGDHIMVTVLVSQEDMEGSNDRHGVTAGGSSTTYCGTVRWTEWKTLLAEPWHTPMALRYITNGDLHNA